MGKSRTQVTLGDIRSRSHCDAWRGASRSPLAPGTACRINVSFTPAGAGNQRGTLTLTDKHGDTQDPAGATQSMPLTGPSPIQCTYQWLRCHTRRLG